MQIMGLSDLTWLAIIAFVLCLAAGLYMVKTKKPGMVRSSRDNAKYKDKEKYSVEGGKLILAYAASWLVLLVASFYSELIAIIIGFIAMIVFAIFWKKMHDEYGPV